HIDQEDGFFSHLIIEKRKETITIRTDKSFKEWFWIYIIFPKFFRNTDVQMWTSGITGISDCSDLLTCLDLLPFLNNGFRHMIIISIVTIIMLYNDVISRTIMISYIYHCSVACS